MYESILLGNNDILRVRHLFDRLLQIVSPTSVVRFVSVNTIVTTAADAKIIITLLVDLYHKQLHNPHQRQQQVKHRARSHQGEQV